MSHLIPTPGGGSAGSHWSSSTIAPNAPGLPDNTGDLTEAIRREGRVGFGVDPLTGLDAAGSLSWGVKNDFLANTTVVFPIDTTSLHFWGGPPTAVQIVELPEASLFPRRIVSVAIGPAQEDSIIKVFTPFGNVGGHDGLFTEETILSVTGVRSAIWQSNGDTWVRLAQSDCSISHEHIVIIPGLATFDNFNGQLYPAGRWHMPQINWSWISPPSTPCWASPAVRVGAAGNWELYCEDAAADGLRRIEVLFKNIAGKNQRFGPF